MPGKNATGTKTEMSTSEVAITAPLTSLMAAEAAACESACSSLMWRWMFSMTTIASSTTSPVASTIPNRVRVLMENPASWMKANAPTSDTGIATAGISVLRHSCRKINITNMTKKIASSSVFSTSCMESPTNVVVSNATWYSSPGGNRVDSLSSSSRHALSTSRALAVGS